MSSSVPQRLNAVRFSLTAFPSVSFRRDPASRPHRSALACTARVLVPAVLALAVVGGCQAQPGAAAFVGNDRIPQSEVDSLSDSVLKAANRPVTQKDLISTRRQLATQLVIDALIEHRLTQLGLTITDAQVEAEIDKSAQQAGGRAAFFAQQAKQGLSPRILRIQVRTQLGVTAIQERVAGNPTENELRAAYAANGGQAAIGQSFAQVRGQLVQYVQGQKLQDDLTRLAKASHVRINPRNGTFDLKSLSVKAADNGLVTTSGSA